MKLRFTFELLALIALGCASFGRRKGSLPLAFKVFLPWQSYGKNR